MLSASKSLVSDDEAAVTQKTVLAVDCEVQGGGHVHAVVLGAASEVAVDVDQIHIPVANDQNNHLRQTLPSDVLVVLPLVVNMHNVPSIAKRATGNGASIMLHLMHTCLSFGGKQITSLEREKSSSTTMSA